SENDQATEPVAAGLCRLSVSLRLRSGVTAASWTADRGPPDQVAATLCARVWVSSKSTSLKVIEPPAVSAVALPVVPAASENEPVAVVEPATMVGASLVPVTVRVTG